MKRVIRGSVTSSKTVDDPNYDIQYFQVFSNPKKPTDKGKMIAQAGTFEEAHQKGKKLVGENNYFLKAVCNDGKVRYIDNDYSGRLIAGSSNDASAENSESANDKFEQLVDGIKEIGNYSRFVSVLKELNDSQKQLFMKYFGEVNSVKPSVSDTGIDVTKLRPTQSEIDWKKSLSYGLKQDCSYFFKGVVTLGMPVLTFRGKYIIDGHHRWSQVFMFNPKGQVACMDFNYDEDDPIDVLKDFQAAVLAEKGQIDVGTAGTNIWDVSESTLTQYITENISEACWKSLVNVGVATDEESAIKYIVNNAMLLQDNIRPAAGAPDRVDMPQTNEAVIRRAAKSLTRMSASTEVKSNKVVKTPKSVKSAKDATFKNDKRLSPTSERYKGYLIVLDRGGDGYNVYDKHRELEDAGYPSREAAKKFIDELADNEDVMSSTNVQPTQDELDRVNELVADFEAYEGDINDIESFKEWLKQFYGFTGKGVQDIINVLNYINSSSEDHYESDGITGASYGGAFDIEDDQYFTKDEIVEFGNTVCDHLNETFYDTYDVSDVYMETPKKLVLTVVQKSDESEFTATIDIDMRKIRKPSDLMNRYLGNVVYALRQDIEAYNNEINASSDITSAKKTGVEWIKTKVWNAIVAKLEDDGWEPDDIADYVFVEVTQADDRIRVEVRAELSYEGLEELIESIDPIVQEYDNNAYFEPVEPGIAEAYIYNLSNVNSSETVEAGIYDVPDRPLDPPEDNSWESLDSDDEVIELTLDAIVHIDEDGSWEYDDTNYPWAASPDNKNGDWYTDEYNVYIGDKTSIVEYVDELLEPMMPAKAGEYHIKGDVTLVFSVEGIEVKRDYFWDERHGADYDEEAYTDDAETSFLYDKSHIKNFEITER